MRKAEAILARFPGPVTLHAIRPKAYVLFAACVGGLAIAAYMLFAAADYRGNLGGMLAAWFAILVSASAPWSARWGCCPARAA